MVPQQHLIVSWVLSNLNYNNRRDRVVTTIAGVIPDVDGLGLVVDKVIGDGFGTYYFQFHHIVAHNVIGLFAIATAAYFICSRKVLPAVVAAVAYYVRLFLDLAGSGAPDDIWPVYFFWPFSYREFSVGWQWPLNGWQNITITAAFMAIMVWIIVKYKRSVFEIFSAKFDRYWIGIAERLLQKINLIKKLKLRAEGIEPTRPKDTRT